MMLDVNNSVIRLEASSSALADLMSEIRTWLDARKIELSVFKTHSTEQGMIVLEIGFLTPSAAEIFQQDFASRLPDSVNVSSVRR